MVAFIDLGPAPTANVILGIPVIMGNSGWTWGELPRLSGVLAREFVYSAAECAALIRAYGRVVSRMIRTHEAERFRLVARGRVTGLVLHSAEWLWDPHTRAYLPDGEAWCGWRAAVKRHWELTGELIGAQRFDAHPNLVVVPDPARRPTVVPLVPAA